MDTKNAEIMRNREKLFNKCRKSAKSPNSPKSPGKEKPKKKPSKSERRWDNEGKKTESLNYGKDVDSTQVCVTTEEANIVGKMGGSLEDYEVSEEESEEEEIGPSKAKWVTIYIIGL